MSSNLPFPSNFSFLFYPLYMEERYHTIFLIDSEKFPMSVDNSLALMRYKWKNFPKGDLRIGESNGGLNFGKKKFYIPCIYLFGGECYGMKYEALWEILEGSGDGRICDQKLKAIDIGNVDYCVGELKQWLHNKIMSSLEYHDNNNKYGNLKRCHCSDIFDYDLSETRRRYEKSLEIYFKNSLKRHIITVMKIPILLILANRANDGNYFSMLPNDMLNIIIGMYIEDNRAEVERHKIKIDR